MEKRHLKADRLLACLVLMVFSSIANAFTAIAIIDKQASQSWSRASNYTSQKEADNDALEGCRVEARKNGIGNLAKQCKVITRATVPGHGALVCGTEGCAWGTGYNSAQEAVDAVYGLCSKSYAKCQDKNIGTWEDSAGFSKKVTALKAPVAADCRPRTNQLQCTSSCTNGSCVVEYENGCHMRVQVQAQFNPINNSWQYPAPPC